MSLDGEFQTEAVRTASIIAERDANYKLSIVHKLEKAKQSAAKAREGVKKASSLVANANESVVRAQRMTMKVKDTATRAEKLVSELEERLKTDVPRTELSDLDRKARPLNQKRMPVSPNKMEIVSGGQKGAKNNQFYTYIDVLHEDGSIGCYHLPFSISAQILRSFDVEQASNTLDGNLLKGFYVVHTEQKSACVAGGKSAKSEEELLAIIDEKGEYIAMSEPTEDES
jgi:hypothetical protein